MDTQNDLDGNMVRTYGDIFGTKVYAKLNPPRLRTVILYGLQMQSLTRGLPFMTSVNHFDFWNPSPLSHNEISRSLFLSSDFLPPPQPSTLSVIYGSPLTRLGPALLPSYLGTVIEERCGVGCANSRLGQYPHTRVLSHLMHAVPCLYREDCNTVAPLRSLPIVLD